MAMAKNVAIVSVSKLAGLDMKCAPAVRLLRRAYTVTVGAKNAPPKPRKLPLSAYQLFVKEKVGLMNTNNDNQKPVDRFKRCASEWKDMTEEDKSIYQERSDSQKEEWLRDCAKYEAFLDSLSEVERNRIKIKELLLKATSKEKRQLTKSVADDIAVKMPKRPGSAFQLYFKEELDNGSFEGLKGPELFQAASQKWKSLNEFDKNKFKDLQKELIRKYSEDLEEWKRI